MGGGEDGDTAKDDWFVAASDEEEGAEGGTSSKVPWSPSAEEILSMFAEIKEKKVLELKWTCPGRRAPSPEKGLDDDDGGDDDDIYSDDDIKEQEEKAPEASTFDFDDFGMDASAKMTPRRTPGAKNTPKSQKKVASMDNVLNKIRHQQKEKQALKQARRGMSRSPASPARFRLGMTGSPTGGAGSPRPVMSSTGTPLRAPQPEDRFSPDDGSKESVGGPQDLSPFSRESNTFPKESPNFPEESGDYPKGSVNFPHEHSALPPESQGFPQESVQTEARVQVQEASAPKGTPPPAPESSPFVKDSNMFSKENQANVSEEQAPTPSMTQTEAVTSRPSLPDPPSAAPDIKQPE